MDRSLHSLLCLAVAAACAAGARAQSIYVDCQAWLGATPAPTYGAAYGVPGVWNGLPLVNGTHALVDTHGNPIPAAALVGVGCDTSICTAPELAGDAAALLGDWWNADCYASPNTIRVSGLQAGTYQMFAFGYSECPQHFGSSIAVRINNTFVAGLFCGGEPFPGTWAGYPIGVGSFALASGDQLNLTFGTAGVYSGIAGFQLVRMGDDGTPFCSGHLGGCPCGAGAAGQGCPTSFNPSGAALTGAGAADLAADSLVLMSSGTSSSVVTFFQGTALHSNGLGTTFGDGLRCAGGTTVRLASKLAVGGGATYPEAGEAPISVRGLVPATGGLRTYQVWFRNAADFCTSATFNLTNGVAVHWR